MVNQPNSQIFFLVSSSTICFAMVERGLFISCLKKTWQSPFTWLTYIYISTIYIVWRATSWLVHSLSSCTYVQMECQINISYMYLRKSIFTSRKSSSSRVYRRPIVYELSSWYGYLVAEDFQYNSWHSNLWEYFVTVLSTGDQLEWFPSCTVLISCPIDKHVLHVCGNVYSTGIKFPGICS